MLAEVLQFYGLGWDELLALEIPWFSKLYQRIPVVEARRLLALMPVLAYPHMDTRRQRTQLHKDLVRQAGYELMQRYGTTVAQQAQGWERLRGVGRPAAPAPDERNGRG